MRIAPGLDPLASQLLVDQLVGRLTDAGVRDLLDVTPSRLAALMGGRGRLTGRQLDRVTVATGRAWPLWVLDAGRGSSDPVARAEPLRRALARSADGDRQRAEAALSKPASTGKRPRRPKPAA